MRWTRSLGALAILVLVSTGCKQQCFQRECDLDHYRQQLYGDIENDPQAGSEAAGIAYSERPSTVLDPSRESRYLSLAEAISIALEQGTVGNQNLNIVQGSQFGTQTGFGIDTLGISFSDSIRAFALDPAVSGATIERALSKFDTIFLGSANWTTTDIPIGTALQAFQAGQAGLNSINTEAFSGQVGLVKPLPTGGIAGITFQTDYQFTNLPARVNPSYTPSLTFNFEQPLLRFFGVDQNQLSALFPGPLLSPQAASIINRGQAQEGILITRIRFDQSRAELERLVNLMLVNVEVAYWTLYSSYFALYAREQALRLSYETWRATRERFKAGKINVAILARTRGEYERTRNLRLQALGSVIENERQLRKLLGMSIEDGTRLVPSDKPTVAPYRPDWDSALQEALALRPELIQARDELKVAQLTVREQKNLLLPDLRFTFSYNINGIGPRLDGAAPNNAFRSFGDNNFNNINGGLQMSVPLGFRNEHAAVRQARLRLARNYAVLRDQELKAQQFLALRYRRLIQTYEQIKVLRAQRQAFAIQLQADFERFRKGLAQQQGDVAAPIQAILDSQRFWADALAEEYANISAYNAELAGFEFAKGTIQRHNNVAIAEGMLPECALERAKEHYKKRTHSLVLMERAVPHSKLCTDNGVELSMPELKEGETPSLPGLMKSTAPSVEGNGPFAAPALKNARNEPPLMENSVFPKQLPATKGAVLPSGILNPAANPSSTLPKSRRPSPYFMKTQD